MKISAMQIIGAMHYAITDMDRQCVSLKGYEFRMHPGTMQTLSREYAISVNKDMISTVFGLDVTLDASCPRDAVYLMRKIQLFDEEISDNAQTDI